ncbi:MAG: hypothetical protein E6531_39475, partial [Bradyrhizobium sp.]|nr:hypothetical protein [Bradyrhizobium sp.]
TVDPAHATKSVPLNVQRFINLFLSDNILGGGDVVALAVLLGAVAEAAPAIAACGIAATAKNRTSSAGQHRPAAVSAASSQPLVIRATPVIRAPGKAQS